MVKEIFKVMPKFSDTPLPPLDEEMLSDLAKIPAKLDGECTPQHGILRVRFLGADHRTFRHLARRP